jgi:quinol monooxygenase YgiN
MRAVAIIHHRVADFDAWKQVYDDFGEAQREGGVLEHSVLRPADDPSMVVVTHTFASRADADAFIANADLKDAMIRAGVDPDSIVIETLDEVAAATFAAATL